MNPDVLDLGDAARKDVIHRVAEGKPVMPTEHWSDQSEKGFKFRLSTGVVCARRG